MDSPARPARPFEELHVEIALLPEGSTGEILEAGVVQVRSRPGERHRRAAGACLDALSGVDATCAARAGGSRSLGADPARGAGRSPCRIRAAETLVQKGYALDAAGIERALAAAGDPTAQLAALAAASAQRCRGLLPHGEALLGAPPPTAVEAAATLAELGELVARAPRGRLPGCAALGVRRADSAARARRRA